MNWRPWIILALLLGVVVVNSALMYFEEIAAPEGVAEVKDEVKDKLAGIPFTPSTRRSNFKSFGLTDDMVETASTQIKRLMAREARFKELLTAHADVVGPALCAGGLPQRYSAMAFLVQEQEGKRVVMDPERVTFFEVQPWYDPALVQDVYNEVELSSPPRENSTVMGVSAVLLGKEDSVIEGKSPWGRGLGSRWSFDSVLKNHGDAKRLLIAYFSFMHLLTEYANQDGGVCG